jgi:hypothetical protein
MTFGGGGNYWTLCFWFSLQLLTETFLILKRNEQDIVKIYEQDIVKIYEQDIVKIYEQDIVKIYDQDIVNIYKWLYVNYPLFLSDFN